ncbi:MAG: hypothetical protein JNL24_09205 [Bacteroidia bacterium]|nr:hypothetical protein [Bacteroidia bacterium]
MAIKPHENSAKSNRIGDAGHIVGAFGPRHDPKLKESDYRKIENGIWLCKVCHKIVDTEDTKYTIEELKRWKNETENYVEELVLQDTRLRQLRILCHSYISALRVVSGKPTKLDYTFENPFGNGINLTRSFMELELVLFENTFIREAEIIHCIWQDLTAVCQNINNNAGIESNITEWKNEAIKLFMIYIMRYSSDSYSKYLQQEGVHTTGTKRIELAKSQVALKMNELLEEEKKYA